MAKTALPKKKGGKVYPRLDLAAAEEIAAKLVSKSHAKALSKDIYYSAGVLGAKGSHGDVRASAIKQYGFVEGTVKNGVEASTLAKNLISAPQEEKQEHRRVSCLKPVIFEKLFHTFQGDAVSIHKIRQQASALGVHPEKAEECAEIFVRSAAHAQLASQDGDNVNFLGPDQVPVSQAGTSDDDEDELTPEQNDANRDGHGGQVGEMRTKGGAVVNVSLTVDSSMDADKLEKQMQTLRKYGII